MSLISTTHRYLSCRVVVLIVCLLGVVGCREHATAVCDGGIPSDAVTCVGDGNCACGLSTPLCLADDVVQTCIENGDGGVALDVSPCPDGSTCVDGVGCVMCTDSCIPGAVKCADDFATVLECQPTGPANCLEFVPVLDCTSVGLSACIAPNDPTMVTDLQEYCVNECGGRNLPLEHSVCEPHDTLNCSVWVCDPATDLLMADHTACLPGGVSCQNDSECRSCFCDNGTCIGSMVMSCSEACR